MRVPPGAVHVFPPVTPPAIDDPPDQLVLYSRAVEATIWGLPAVSMAALRRSLPRDLDARCGDIVYFSDVPAPRHELLAANSRTPYVLTVLDLANGPMVLDVPAASEDAALSGSALDSWQVPLVDVGAGGEDAGRGGRYVFLPPGHDADRPAGFIAVRSPTRYVHVALRPVAKGRGTLAAAVAHGQRVRTWALAAAGDPPPTRRIDAHPNAWRTLPPFDERYLDLLAEVVRVEPWQAKDASMAGVLASIGIEKGRPFQPDRHRLRFLAGAVREAEAYLRGCFVNRTFAAHWPDRRWLAPRLENTHGLTFCGDGVLDYDRRAAFFYGTTWVPRRTGEHGELPASAYLCAFQDAARRPFRGSRRYRLRMPADTAAGQSWSVVAYDAGTNAFIHSPADRVGLSSHDRGELTPNPDGSVDLHIGPEAPWGLDRNWIPTAGRDFWLMCRFSGPERALIDRTWKFDDAVEVG